MDRQHIEKIIGTSEYLKDKLFCRGFLLTDDDNISSQEYPFFGRWKKETICEGRVSVYCHPRIPFYKKESNGVAVGLLGHAYNPICGLIDENAILDELLVCIDQQQTFFNKVNELTGVFTLFCIKDGRLMVLSDAVGLQSVFYCMKRKKFYVSTHANLIGDLLFLTEDPYVTALKSCRTFKLFGNQLPGNISRFKEIKRLNPNHYITIGDTIEQIRFYWPHQRQMTATEISDKLENLLQETMRLIAEKWSRPAISMTGGCDSKTTLACASHIYDKFSYFSYDSQENEKPDAAAAAQICQKLGLPHTIYRIPYDDGAFDSLEEIRSVLLWNNGDVRYNNANDVRKRAYLDGRVSFDVEVKSWASEVGRSRYTKRYNGKRHFGSKPTPRKCTTFYKFLFFNRRIVNDTDNVFKDYIDRYYEPAAHNPIPWQDQFYWEWHWPSRDGINLTSEQMYAYEITVPYNNRIVLELLLSATEEDRIQDSIYTEIRRKLDSRIDEAAKAVVDVNHTKKRAIGELLYYYANNILPY